jgi:hypothetical protein
MTGIASEGRTLHRLVPAVVSILVALAGCAALAVRATDAIQAASRARSPQQVTHAQASWLLFGCLNQALHDRIPKGAAIFIDDQTSFGQQRLAEFAFWDYRVVDRATDAQYRIALSRPRNPQCRDLSLTVTRR